MNCSHSSLCLKNWQKGFSVSRIADILEESPEIIRQLIAELPAEKKWGNEQMDDHFLAQTRLFWGVSPAEIRKILSCLGAEQKTYPKGAFIYHAGDLVSSLGLVLSGRVQIEFDDPWGNKSMLDSVGPGQVFAETYASIPEEPLMVSVTAAQESDILFLNVSRLLCTCPETCAHHAALIRNLLAISARKNISLSRRIFHTSSKSIRGRLISYLSFEAMRHKSNSFTIPFNRQQLADYLRIDRSALSAELGKMRREGLLETDRSHFLLKNLSHLFTGFK